MKARRLFIFLLLLPLGACVTVPFDYPSTASHAIDPATPTRLATIVDEWQAAHPGSSGFYPLTDGMSALGARIRLIEAAEETIDAQYFLMKGDTAGQVFAGALLDAADRGVRVRFLLDDVFTTVKDEELDLLDAHPNIEVRLHNPVARGGLGPLNYLLEFRRANRRMHNKSFTVDNQVTIVGGRNIADEYFELRPEGEFLDFDVIGFGPVAAEVSAQFDQYWNHHRSLPIAALSSKFDEEELNKVRFEIIEEYATVGGSVYEEARTTELIEDLANDRRHLFPAAAEVISDDPEKLVVPVAPEQQILVNRLHEVVSNAQQEVIVFTPYLVPGDQGVEFWGSLAERGVRVVILTNSLASNNHTAVHSGYAKYRKPLLDAGVELYEARADAVTPGAGVEAEALTLHTKALLIDRRLTFIGSLNLDPRSIEINSEMGLLIDSAELGEILGARIDERLPEMAYRLGRDARGRLEWRAHINGVEVVENSEPLASGGKKFMAFVLKIVPDSQL
jgi:putative cardiolipin synthase